jgi:protein SCO1/2
MAPAVRTPAIRTPADPARRRLMAQGAAALLAGLAAPAFPRAAMANPAADGGWGAKLSDAAGTPVGGEMLVGKPYAIYFGYLRCPDICPTSMADMTEVLARLDKGAHAAAAHDFHVYFVSVDPERDSAAELKTYLEENFDHRIVALSGTPEAIATVARTFRVIYKKTGSAPNYAITHTASIFLVDRHGRLVGKMPHGGTIERKVEQVTALFDG